MVVWGGRRLILKGRGCSSPRLKGCKFRILVSLRVFCAKRLSLYLAVKVSFSGARENKCILYLNVF